MVQDSLERIIKPLRYGEYHLAQTKPTIISDGVFGRILIDQYVRLGEEVDDGTCAELAFSAARKIKRQHPDLHVYFAKGNAASLFLSEAEHTYLIVSEDDLLNGQDYTDERAVIDQILESDPLIVDPSLGLVGKRSELSVGNRNYEAVEIFGDNYEVQTGNSIVLGHGQAFPIARITHQKEPNLLLAVADCREGGRFQFGVVPHTEADTDGVMYNDRGLRRILKKKPRAAGLVKYLGKARIQNRTITDDFIDHRTIKPADLYSQG